MYDYKVYIIHHAIKIALVLLETKMTNFHIIWRLNWRGRETLETKLIVYSFLE